MLHNLFVNVIDIVDVLKTNKSGFPCKDTKLLVAVMMSCTRENIQDNTNSANINREETFGNGNRGK